MNLRLAFNSASARSHPIRLYRKFHFLISLQANWYRASQYCRYHGMHLASIASQEENDRLEKHIKDFGLGHEHFWTSGTDQAEEGTFFWMANGRPITFENWNVGEPNNFRYEPAIPKLVRTQECSYNRTNIFRILNSIRLNED